MTRYEHWQAASGSSPFLTAFLRTDRVWDESAKKEWADDVERRLRDVKARIDPRPQILGYSVQRFNNCVAILTVSPNEQSEEELLALARGQWPCWDEIVKGVPEFIHSKVGFDACRSFEWWRKWDVEVGISRLRLKDGMVG